MAASWIRVALFVVIGLAATRAGGAAPRVCQTPDCLLVESVQLAKEVGITEEEVRTNLYVWVPPATRSFTLAVFDQPDDTPVARPSRFTLQGPAHAPVVLERPVKGGWAEYPVETGDDWGVWRLAVDPPEGPARACPEGARTPAKASNALMVRTTGDVDLYFLPPASVRARGLRFGPPRFGGEATHRWTAMNPGYGRVRYQIMRGKDPAADELSIDTRGAALHWGGLGRGGVEYVDLRNAQAPLSQVSVATVREPYVLGTEQGLRLFCTEAPLMPVPRRVPVRATLDGQPVAARLEPGLLRTAREAPHSYSGKDGRGFVEVVEGDSGTVTASAGFESGSATAPANSKSGEVVLELRRRLHRPAGWFCGDNHAHTTWYDGGHTPAQVVEAARGEGLDWIAVTEHAQENRTRPAMAQVRLAMAEAAAGNDPGRFLVIPGLEFTTQTFHANVLNDVLELPATASLQELVDAAAALDRPDHPVTVKLNHPSLSGGKAAQIGRTVRGLPLVELWNSSEPAATRFWWDLLNEGRRVFAETSSDSHSRRTAPPGHRRTYVYLGDAPLSANAVVRALREGRSFLSRGALVDFRLNGQRAGSTVAAGALKISAAVDSVLPVDRVELVRNGEVLRSLPAEGKLRLDARWELPGEPGWYLVQVQPAGKERVPLALTNPVFVGK